LEVWPVYKFIPKHFLINKLPFHQARDIILASAPLPFGIFPPVDIGGKTYCDGGVADNLPIYPLTNENACDELVIIQLRPKSESVASIEGGSKQVSYKKYWSAIDRTIRLGSLAHSDARSLIENEHGADLDDKETWIRPPRLLPLKEPTDFPSRIVTIAPDESFGGMVLGTLNFSSEKAQQLMALGYEDAMQVIDSQIL
jgi:predicted acylesterase/phospholipase RssA